MQPQGLLHLHFDLLHALAGAVEAPAFGLAGRQARHFLDPGFFIRDGLAHGRGEGDVDLFQRDAHQAGGGADALQLQPRVVINDVGEVAGESVLFVAGFELRVARFELLQDEVAFDGDTVAKLLRHRAGGFVERAWRPGLTDSLPTPYSHRAVEGSRKRRASVARDNIAADVAVHLYRARSQRRGMVALRQRARAVDLALPDAGFRFDFHRLDRKRRALGLRVAAGVIGQGKVIRVLEVQHGMLAVIGAPGHHLARVQRQIGHAHQAVLLRHAHAGEGFEQRQREGAVRFARKGLFILPR